jgi:hypothetical protein
VECPKKSGNVVDSSLCTHSTLGKPFVAVKTSNSTGVVCGLHPLNQVGGWKSGEVAKIPKSFFPTVWDSQRWCVYSSVIFGAMWKDLSHPLLEGGGGVSLITQNVTKNQGLCCKVLHMSMGLLEYQCSHNKRQHQRSV